MTTKIGWIIVAVIAVVLAAAAVLLLRAPSANNIPENGMDMRQAQNSGTRHQVFMRNGVFVPQELMIRIGDEIEFINEDETARWPASGIHPTHMLCQGFDSLKGLSKGESYSFKFSSAGSCPMHDHLMPGMRGKIIVE